MQEGEGWAPQVGGKVRPILNPIADGGWWCSKMNSVGYLFMWYGLMFTEWYWNWWFQWTRHPCGSCCFGARFLIVVGCVFISKTLILFEKVFYLEIKFNKSPSRCWNVTTQDEELTMGWSLLYGSFEMISNLLANISNSNAWFDFWFPLNGSFLHRFLDWGAVGDANEPGESSKGANKNDKINLRRMVVNG